MQIEDKRILISGAGRGLWRTLIGAFEERHDPPIGSEAEGILETLMKDPLGLETNLMNYR